MHQPVSTKTGEQPSQASQSLVEPFTSYKTHTSLRKIFWFTLKILAGLTLLILSIQGIQLENLMTGIRSAELSWLALAILSVLLGLFLKVLRWSLFLNNYHIQAGNARIFSAYFVGQAANIILPFRGGELVRLGYFAGEKKIIPEAASTIILEKYLDLLALTVCGIMVSLRISLDNILTLRGWLLPLTILGTLLLLAAILFGPAAWENLRDRKLLPNRLIDWLDHWVHASEWLRNPKQVIPGVLLTILIWGIMWFTNLLLFKSLGLSLGGTAAGLVLILVYIGLFPALMPGNIGPFYFFGRLALLPFGIIHDQALVFAVVLHAIVTLPPLTGGAIGLLINSPRPSSS